MNWVATTKCFFVLNISSTGPQSGFSVQGNMTSVVKNAICASEIPMLLYMRVDTVAIATKGSPSAKYSVGTQRAGRMSFVASVVMSNPNVKSDIRCQASDI